MPNDGYAYETNETVASHPINQAAFNTRLMPMGMMPSHRTLKDLMAQTNSEPMQHAPKMPGPIAIDTSPGEKPCCGKKKAMQKAFRDFMASGGR